MADPILHPLTPVQHRTLTRLRDEANAANTTCNVYLQGIADGIALADGVKYQFDVQDGGLMCIPLPSPDISFAPDAAQDS